MDKASLGNPETLGPARAVAHAAAQLLYRTAVANIAPLPGDEHSNLGWDVDRFQTHPLNASGLMAALRLDPLELSVGEEKLLLAGVSVTDALDWIDRVLADNGLKPASPVAVTYDLPDDVAGVTAFTQVEGLAELANWFALAAASLQAFAGSVSDLEPGPSPVRCWPHHFDIATYVGLEAGDFETARGIGVGLSPGDGSYDEPYFYVNPWPHLDAAGLPDPIAPGRWHTQGFVGSVATGSEILTLTDITAGTTEFLNRSFQAGRVSLGTYEPRWKARFCPVRRSMTRKANKNASDLDGADNALMVRKRTVGGVERGNALASAIS